MITIPDKMQCAANDNDIYINNRKKDCLYHFIRLLFSIFFITVIFGIKNGYSQNIGLGVHWSSALIGSIENLETGADSLKPNNVNWLRVYFHWDKIQPSQNKWNWSKIDIIIDSLVNRGYILIGTLISTPQWCSSNPDTINYPTLSQRYPPIDTMFWNIYIDSVVSRFHSKIKYWEIWNEPNSGIYFITQNITDKPFVYYTMLKSAYNIIKSIDSSSNILIGGLTSEVFNKPTSILFIDSVFKLGGFNYFDIMNIHLYKNIISLKNGYDSLYQVWAINQKPIWVTETNNGNALRPNNSLQNSADNMCSWIKDSVIATFNPQVICWFPMVNFARDSIYGFLCDTCDPNKTLYGLFDTQYNSTQLLAEIGKCYDSLIIDTITDTIIDASVDNQQINYIQINTYPNPSSDGIFIINYENDKIKNYDWILTDILGRIIQTGNSSKIKVDSNGFFILSILNNNGLTTKKLINQSRMHGNN